MGGANEGSKLQSLRRKKKGPVVGTCLTPESLRLSKIRSEEKQADLGKISKLDFVSMPMN